MSQLSLLRLLKEGPKSQTNPVVMVPAVSLLIFLTFINFIQLHGLNDAMDIQQKAARTK